MAAVALSAQKLPVEGRADSPVQVLIFEDLQCSDCAAFRLMLDQKLLPQYGSKVAFAHRDFPLAKHPNARNAAIAGRYFASLGPEMGIGWRRFILASLADKNHTFEQKLADFAHRHHLKPEEAGAALSNASYAAAVESDYQDGVARGVSKTPTVYVNGQPFIETFTFEEISKGIDQAIAETK